MCCGERERERERERETGLNERMKECVHASILGYAERKGGTGEKKEEVKERKEREEWREG